MRGECVILQRWHAAALSRVLQSWPWGSDDFSRLSAPWVCDTQTNPVPTTAFIFVPQDNFHAREAWRGGLHSSWWFMQCECPTGKEVVRASPAGLQVKTKCAEQYLNGRSLPVPFTISLVTFPNHFHSFSLYYSSCLRNSLLAMLFYLILFITDSYSLILGNRHMVQKTFPAILPISNQRRFSLELFEWCICWMNNHCFWSWCSI